MKHIKTFENWFKKTEYNIGDYVKYKPNKEIGYIFGKILAIFKNRVQFLISDEDFSDDVSKSSWCSPSSIKRKLNAKELEEVKFKEDMKKYNL